MPDLKGPQFSDSLRNMAASFQMEGLTLNESIEECLEQINAKFAIESALDEADYIAEQSDSRYSFDAVFERVKKRTREGSNS